MKLVVNIKGVTDVQKRLEEFYAEAEERINELSDITSRDIELNAKQLAPYDTGNLRQNINWVKPISRKKGVIQNIVQANAHYAAYQEFGTGTEVDIPPGWEDIASEFGPKPNSGKINIPAKPFMYPAFAKAKIQFPKDVKQLVNKLTKKFNK